MGSQNLKKGLVSFCCLSYKHGIYIKDCLDSIINQDYKDIEIFAMDDGSPDSSGNVLAEYADKSSFPINIILQEHTGNVSRNFNTMLHEASGEFVFFIAMDDFIEKDTITSMVKFFIEDNNLAFVASKLNNSVNSDGKIIKRNMFSIDWRKEKEPKSAHDFLEIEYKCIHSFFIQGALFKKEIIDAIGGFDEDLIGDDINLRTKLFRYMVVNQELTFKFLNKSFLNYRRHEGNVSKDAYRQVCIVKEWRDRYFPEREVPDLTFSWLCDAFNQNIVSRNIKKYANCVLILDSFIHDKSVEEKENYIDKIFMSQRQIKKCRYGIPFILEVNNYKQVSLRIITVIILGIKVFEKKKCHNMKNIKIFSFDIK